MESIAIHVAIWGTLLVLAVVFYLRSKSSRRSRTCPQCGEQVTVELMTARNCPCCGAALGPESRS